jgi:hypothetical protein
LLFSELPPATDTFFGRTSELLTIEKALDPSKPGQKGIVLYGIGGSGKTQLALRYIEQHKQLYTAIFWINASTEEYLIQSFANAAEIISAHWPVADLFHNYTTSSGYQKVTGQLQSTSYTKWLLIIDSVDDFEQVSLKQYVPRCSHGSVIITSTQSRTGDVIRMPGLEVDHLDPGSSRELLLTCASRSTIDVSSEGEVICNLLT